MSDALESARQICFVDMPFGKKTDPTSGVETDFEQDSPLFQLFSDFPGIEISHEPTDIFMDRIRVADEFQQKLDVALQSEREDEIIDRLKRLEIDLGDLHARDNQVLMKLS